MEKEKLEKIVANHGRWLQDDGGKCADLAGADLAWADLAGVNLRGADLTGTNLQGTNLRGAVLRYADLQVAHLCGADLEGADLEGACLLEADLEKANLYGANLCGANLRLANLRHANLGGVDMRGAGLEGANLPVGMYQITGVGSCNRCTSYSVINDQIVCGCWDDGKGNHLDSFIKRIEEVYGPYEESYHPIYYAEYMAVVNFFKAMKELKENHDRHKM